LRRFSAADFARLRTARDGGSLNRRSLELEQMLKTKGWTGPYARDI